MSTFKQFLSACREAKGARDDAIEEATQAMHHRLVIAEDVEDPVARLARRNDAYVEFHRDVLSITTAYELACRRAWGDFSKEAV